MERHDELIEKLKNYFGKRDDVVMAFVFGSQAKEYARTVSDWDVGVYFKPRSAYELELEVVDREYPEVHHIWSDVEQIVSAEVDLVVLNRAQPPLVFSALNNGIPLAVKDRALYIRLLQKTHYEAVDFWQFVQDFWRIRERSHSFSPEDESNLIKLLTFLENELEELSYFQNIAQQQYTQDRMIKRNIEHWTENLVMAALDVAKIVLSAEKKSVPNSYREVLRDAGLYYFDEEFAMEFAEFAEMRNIIAHEYLDIRWKRIQQFIAQAARLYPRFLTRMKEFLTNTEKKVTQ